MLRCVWLLHTFLLVFADYNLDGWESVGCWRDLPLRAMASLEGRSKVLSKNWKNRTDPLTKCAEAASEQNIKVFAIQDGGQCFGGLYAQYFFDQYGPSNLCKNGLGGTWSNNVYSSKTAYERVLKEEKVDQEPIKCKKPLDLVFLIDGSGKPTLENKLRWGEMLKFVSKATEEFDPDLTKFGIVKYGSTPKVLFNMTTDQDVLKMRDTLMEEQFPGGKRTINDALKVSWKEMLKNNKNAGNKVVLALTSGNIPYGPWGSTLFLTKRNVRVMAFGIDKEPNYKYLESLSSWKRPENIYSLDSEQLLKAVPFVTKDICTGAKKTKVETVKKDKETQLIDGNEFETVGSALERPGQKKAAVKSVTKLAEHVSSPKLVPIELKAHEQGERKTFNKSPKAKLGAQSEATHSEETKEMDTSIPTRRIVETPAENTVTDQKPEQVSFQSFKANHEGLPDIDTFMYTGDAVERSGSESEAVRNSKDGKGRNGEKFQVDKSSTKGAVSSSSKTADREIANSSSDLSSEKTETESRTENEFSQSLKSQSGYGSSDDQNSASSEVTHAQEKEKASNDTYKQETYVTPERQGSYATKEKEQSYATAEKQVTYTSPEKPVAQETYTVTEKPTQFSNAEKQAPYVKTAKQGSYGVTEEKAMHVNAEKQASYVTTGKPIELQSSYADTEKQGSYGIAGSEGTFRTAEKQGSYANAEELEAYSKAGKQASSYMTTGKPKDYQSPSAKAEKQGSRGITEKQGTFATAEKQRPYAKAEEQAAYSKAGKQAHVTTGKPIVLQTPSTKTNNQRSDGIPEKQGTMATAEKQGSLGIKENKAAYPKVEKQASYVTTGKPTQSQAQYAKTEKPGSYAKTDKPSPSGTTEKQELYMTTGKPIAEKQENYAKAEKQLSYGTSEKPTQFSKIEKHASDVKTEKQGSNYKAEKPTQFSRIESRSPSAKAVKEQSYPSASSKPTNEVNVSGIEPNSKGFTADKSVSSSSIGHLIDESQLKVNETLRNETASNVNSKISKSTKHPINRDFDKEIFAKIQKERDSFGDEEEQESMLSPDYNLKEYSDNSVKDEKLADDAADLISDDPYDPVTTDSELTTQRALEQKKKEIDILLRKLDENRRRKRAMRKRRKIKISKYFGYDDLKGTDEEFDNDDQGEKEFTKNNKENTFDSEKSETDISRKKGNQGKDSLLTTRHFHRISQNDSKPLPLQRPVVPTTNTAANVLGKLYNMTPAANVKLSYDIFDPVYSSAESKNLTKENFDKFMTELKLKKNKQFVGSGSKLERAGNGGKDHAIDHQQFFLRHKINHESKSTANQISSKPLHTQQANHIGKNNASHVSYAHNLIRKITQEEDPVSRTIHISPKNSVSTDEKLSDFHFSSLSDVDSGRYTINKVSKNRILVTLRSKTGELQTFYGTTERPSEPKGTQPKTEPFVQPHARVKPIQVTAIRKGFEDAIKVPETIHKIPKSNSLHETKKHENLTNDETHHPAQSYTKNNKQTAFDLYDNRLAHVDKPISYFTKPRDRDRLIITENDDPSSDSSMIKLFVNSGNEDSVLNSDVVGSKLPQPQSRFIHIVEKDLPTSSDAKTTVGEREFSHQGKEFEDDKEISDEFGVTERKDSTSQRKETNFDGKESDYLAKGSDEDGEESDESEKEPTEAGKRSDQAEKESDKSGKKSDKSGKESDKSGKESDKSGKASDKSGKESDKSGKKSDKSGKESENSGMDSEKSGKESDKSGKESENSGKDSDKSGKESDKSGKELDKSGKESDKPREESDKAGKESNKSERESIKYRKETDQAGKEFEKSGRESDESGKEPEQSIKEPDKSGKESDKSGKELDKSGKEFEKSGRGSAESVKESDKVEKDLGKEKAEKEERAVEDDQRKNSEDKNKEKKANQETKSNSLQKETQSSIRREHDSSQENSSAAEESVISKLQKSVGCHKPMKVMYVVDVSDGIGTGPSRKNRWQHLKRFLQNVNDKITQGGNMGYIVYDSEPRFISNLEPCDEKTEYFITSNDCLCDKRSAYFVEGRTSCTTHAPTPDESIEDWGAQGPRTAKALQMARKYFQDDVFGNSKKLIVLLTHQASTDDVTSAEKALKDDSISLVDIEIGERHNLRKRSASLDEVIPRDHQMEVSFYKLDKAIQNIVRKICSEKDPSKVRRSRIYASKKHRFYNWRH